jgi:LPXTG-motif cell wall-anchored protein
LTRFLYIQNLAGTAKYYGVDITPAGNMNSTTVAIAGNRACTNNPSGQILRCFEITPGTSQSATVKFWYTEAERNTQTANALKLFHYNGSTWGQVGTPYSYSESGTTCTSGSGLACWVQGTAISAYSPFSPGGGSGPTAVEVTNLTARTNMSAFGILLGAVLVGLIGLLVWRKRQR